jgi:hypothetical protein
VKTLHAYRFENRWKSTELQKISFMTRNIADSKTEVHARGVSIFSMNFNTFICFSFILSSLGGRTQGFERIDYYDMFS